MTNKLAWAIGLFEGEGSIVTREYRHSIQLTLYSSDEDIVRRFRKIVGFGKVFGPIARLNKISSGPAKPMFEWRAYGPNAKNFLSSAKPLFSRRRREKTMIALRMK